ncbi:hypothetical protein CDL12_26861 [Handroanthus impetiginosus]|uniref:FAF domain-containing protein n=1 Tax=Handroanthus impetiginosus TaxID=429701 RepID=A0A2G9G5Q4_9LAMI|nr:hypothetical protein CDL12_26861 [Handroanthus impetiginosus]
MPVRKIPLHLSSLHDPMKQGILSILCSDCEKTKATSSIRRTISADMSSKNWLMQNLFKSSSFPLQDEDVYGKMQKLDFWSSIFTQKSENSAYVHPLVKRSSSCLSEKSLEFCTENLGSETGSDGFCSESADEDEIKEVNPPPAVRIPPVRSFPPPLSSISSGDGPSLQMHSRRENGRLVLEAVSVPHIKNFHAQRRDGRLVLTFVNSSDEVEEETADDGGGLPEEEFERGNVAKEVGFEMGSGMVSVDKSEVALTRMVPPPPPLPPPPTAASWRNKTAVYGGFVDIRGKKTEHVAPYLRGCNGPKRSILIWEPYYIATS